MMLQVHCDYWKLTPASVVRMKTETVKPFRDTFFLSILCIHGLHRYSFRGTTPPPPPTSPPWTQSSTGAGVVLARGILAAADTESIRGLRVYARHAGANE